jgi:hypothetical protein
VFRILLEADRSLGSSIDIKYGEFVMFILPDKEASLRLEEMGDAETQNLGLPRNRYV